MIAATAEAVAEQLATLQRYGVFDAAPERAFDRITALAAMVFDVPVAFVSLLGGQSPSFQSCAGSPVKDAPRDVAFCAHTLMQTEPLVVNDTLGDERFAGNPLVTGAPHLRFYAGVPLVTPDGHKLGALGIADTRPRYPSTSQLRTLVDLASMVMAELEMRKQTKELERKQQDLIAARDQLAQLATTDELTGIANKRGLNQRLQLLEAEAERGRKYAVTMIDIDHFKKLNDTFGHAEGDRTLRAIAQVLAQSIRKTDFVARYGGEEFCVVFTDVDGQTAMMLAERLRIAVAAWQGAVRVTASFGVAACASKDRAPAAPLLAAADQALYRAKHAGRNRVCAARRTMPSAKTAKPTRAAA